MRRLRPAHAPAALQRRLDGAPPAELVRLLRGRWAGEILPTVAALRLRTRIATLPQMTDLLVAARQVPALALDLDHSRGHAPRMGPALAAAGAGGRLRELSLAFCDIGPAQARALLRCPQLAGLTSLHLGGNPLGGAGLRALARAARPAGLRALSLPDTQLRSDDLRPLRGASHLAGLQALDLDHNALGARAVVHLIAATQLRGLTRLSLEHQWTREAAIDVAGIAALLGAPHLTGLRALPCAPPRDAEPPGFPPLLAALAALTEASGLTTLVAGETFDHAPLGAGDVTALARLPHLAGLRTLHLVAHSPGEAAALALRAAPFWPQLTELCYCGSKLGAGPAATLLTAPTLTALRDLTICVPEHRPCRALAAATQLTALAVLRPCGFGREHVADLDHLARAPHLASLRELHLAGPYDGDLPSRALRAATALSRLDVLHLEPQRISQAAMRTLRTVPHLARLRRLWLLCRDGELTSDAPLRLGRLRAALGRLELGTWHGPTPPAAARTLVGLLAYGAPLPALVSVDLAHIDLGEEEVWLLANNRACPHLRELDLGFVAWGDVGLLALAHGTGLTSLTHLRVGGSRLTARGVQPFAHARHLGALERLELWDLPLDEEAGQALLTAPGLPRLSRLGCTTGELPALLRRRLAARYGCRIG